MATPYPSLWVHFLNKAGVEVRAEVTVEVAGGMVVAVVAAVVVAEVKINALLLVQVGKLLVESANKRAILRKIVPTRRRCVQSAGRKVTPAHNVSGGIAQSASKSATMLKIVPIDYYRGPQPMPP